MLPRTDHEDVIAGELLRMSLEQISMEMAWTLKRISGSTIITEADDFTVLLYSARGELLDCPMGPGFSGPGGIAIAALLAEHGGNGFTDGDVFLGNDPFSTGALHANDMQVIVPVMLGGACVGFTYMHAHVMDIGGLMPGSWAVGATDCFGEAFRMPFVKYAEAGRISETVRRIVGMNSRLPVLVLNDIQGMATAAQVGAGRLKALIATQGANRYEALLGSMLDRTERAARARLRLLAPGVHETENWIEHNGQHDELYGLRGRLTVSDDTLSFEFTGVPQTSGFVNATSQGVVGQVMGIVAAMLFWDIPINEGIRRILRVGADQGTVACARAPAPVSTGHIDGSLKVGTIIGALVGSAMRGSADPELASRAHAPFGDCVGVGTFAGLDREGVYQVVYDNLGLASGGGGGPTTDGLDAGGPLTATAIRIPDIESLEADYPILFLWRGLGADSGGAGEHRGGTGLDGAWTLTGADCLVGNNVTSSFHLPVRGADGGHPGSTSRSEIVAGIDVARDWIAQGRLPAASDLPEGQLVACKAIDIEMRAGAVWRMRTQGGGGWGDPLARAPGAVVRDVRLGAVSEAAAVDGYCVQLDGSPAGYDRAATDALRSVARAGRLRERSVEDGSGAGGGGPCPACGSLAARRRSTQPLAAALGGFGGFCAPYPGVALDRAVCPDCARVTEARIAVDRPVPALEDARHLERFL